MSLSLSSKNITPPHFPLHCPKSMSNPPNNITYLTQAIRNGRQERESFHKFFECWIVEQNQHLEELISASKEVVERRHLLENHQQEAEEDRVLRPLLERVVQHYEHYYRAKARCGKADILSMFNPTWLSSLEDAFLWIGGWRPSMAFHLLYSESGRQLEARLPELMQGLATGDLSDLTLTQLEQVDRLQKETIYKEKEVTENLAKLQETVADSSMVELAHVMTEAMREGGVDRAVDGGRVDEALAPKQDGLVGILQLADDLRLETLRKVIGILNPMQAMHYLIAAAALHQRVHEWGKKRDANGHAQHR